MKIFIIDSIFSWLFSLFFFVDINVYPSYLCTYTRMNEILNKRNKYVLRIVQRITLKDHDKNTLITQKKKMKKLKRKKEEKTFVLLFPSHWKREKKSSTSCWTNFWVLPHAGIRMNGFFFWKILELQLYVL